MRKKINYLNNKDLMKEIHASKISFCEYDEDWHAEYDVIAYSTTEALSPEALALGRKRKATRMTEVAFNKALEGHEDPDSLKLSQFKVDPHTIPLEDMVFKLITYDHIPMAPGRKRTPKTEADHHVKLTFVPFKHYTYVNGEFTEVLRSHFKDGEFSITHGAMTGKLAKMLMLLVNKYSQRSNWRGYTYLDEMKGQALLQLSMMGLQFNEAKSSNPFSYLTSSLRNSFTKILNIEKRNQNLRDDLLESVGQNPSFTRQLAIEDEIRALRGNPNQ